MEEQRRKELELKGKDLAEDEPQKEYTNNSKYPSK
jgi:hypothetical protein